MLGFAPVFNLPTSDGGIGFGVVGIVNIYCAYRSVMPHSRVCACTAVQISQFRSNVFGLHAMLGMYCRASCVLNSHPITDTSTTLEE